MDESIYFIPIPNKDALCCIVCEINSNNVNEFSVKSFFHWQTFKCRYLLDQFKDFVIASPLLNSKSSIQLITTKKFYENGLLTAMLEQLNLKTLQPHPVTARAYTDCIKYTFEFLLAPQWNRVGRQIYIQGRDFLTKSGTSTAMQMTVKTKITDSSDNDEIQIKLLPMTVQLIPFELENLHLNPFVLSEFKKNPNGSINVDHLRTVRIRVLPSLRKGQIISIHKQIPQNCHYQNWTELRRHWKNMYGYRLPEKDSGILFYEIHFPIATAQKSEYFIYPNICITEDLLESSYNGECKIIADEFMNDLTQTMPKVCDSELVVNNQQLKCVKTVPKQEMKFETPIKLSSTRDAEKTGHLSLPTVDRLENHRQLTTPMSPTPSITGKRVNKSRRLNFENFKKVKKIHEPSLNYQSSSTVTDKMTVGAFFNFSTSPFFNTQFKVPVTQKQKVNIFANSPLVKKSVDTVANTPESEKEN